MPETLTVPALATLADSWDLTLRAERKSPQTVKSYRAGVDGYLSWCAEQDAAPLAKQSLTVWVNTLLEAGLAPATARARHLGVRRFSAWLAAEDELEADPFLSVKPPKLDDQPVHPLTDDELRGLLDTCKVSRGTPAKVALRHRRDEAILRLMLECGLRAGEVVALALADVDTRAGTALVRHGKGGKTRRVPFSEHTALALDRYLRARRVHRLADGPDLWLGDRGKQFSYYGLHKTLKERAEAAGVAGFHPHRLRHTAAHRWLAAGGSEGGLMAVAGWSRPDMLARYTAARAEDRAAAEAQRLNLGEL